MKTGKWTTIKLKTVSKLREHFEANFSSPSQEMGGVGLRQLQPGINFPTNPFVKSGAGPGLQLCADQWERGTQTGPRDTGGQTWQPDCDWTRLPEMRDAAPTRVELTSEMRAGERKGQKEESS